MELPVSRGLRQITAGRERPLVLFDLVEALIIEHSHQRGISRCTVRILDFKRPFFLLTRSQTVAESLPRQAKSLVGHWASDGLLVFVTYTVLDPCIGHKQAVTVFFFINKLPVEQLTVLLYDATLNHLVASIDAIDHVEVRIAGAYLNSDRLSIIGELRIRTVEPVVGLRGRFRVIKPEYHKGHVYRVAFAHSL